MQKVLKLSSLCLIRNLNIGGNYTFTQVEEQLNRLIPKHKGNVDLSNKFKEEHSELIINTLTKEMMLSIIQIFGQQKELIYQLIS